MTLYDKLSGVDQAIYSRLRRICDNCEDNFECGQTHDSVVVGVKHHTPVIVVRENGEPQIQWEVCRRGVRE